MAKTTTLAGPHRAMPEGDETARLQSTSAKELTTPDYAIKGGRVVRATRVVLVAHTESDGCALVLLQSRSRWTHVP